MDLNQKIKELKGRFAFIQASFNRDEKQKELRELQVKSTHTNFWQDQQAAQKVMKKIASIEKDIETFGNFSGEFQDLSAMLMINQSDESLEKGIEGEIKKLEIKLEDLETKMFLSGAYDENFAILSIHAGQGGTEAMDWVEMLSRMYQKYFTSKNWDFAIINE